ncbi:MAG: type II toxin-antitoxin system RelE/ParE family toxin [Elusimicrobia bacterium]|nr:type II toxin-antitoxin system RelE/ParE family toxin [Candidatus Obscuribacterium magneticum]
MGIAQIQESRVTFQLLYHPHVARDLKHISTAIKFRIESALTSKLAVAPEIFGKPLSGSLGGYWKLRVGDYRVVFKVVKNEIWILAVIHRSIVYRDALKRLLWNP